MSDAQRASLHAGVPHTDADCPIEAALTATECRIAHRIVVGILALLWVAALVTTAVAPHWQISVFGGTDRMPAGLAAFLGAAVITLLSAKMLIDLARERDEAEAVAARGPDVDPWANPGL